MESSPSPMEHSPGNADPIGRWAEMEKVRTRQRAIALLVIQRVCAAEGTVLLSLNYRSDMISKRAMSSNPNLRTCMICSKATFGEECWVFHTGLRPSKFSGHKRAAHARCVEAARVDMVRSPPESVTKMEA